MEISGRWTENVLIPDREAMSTSYTWNITNVEMSDFNMLYWRDTLKCVYRLKSNYPEKSMYMTS